MSTRERVQRAIDSLDDSMLDKLLIYIDSLFEEDFNDETKAVLDDVENGRNLSRAFNSVDELWEDLNADD